MNSVTKRTQSLCLIAGLVGTLGTFGLAQGAEYTFYPLTNPTSPNFADQGAGTGISNSGQIVGNSYSSGFGGFSNTGYLNTPLVLLGNSVGTSSSAFGVDTGGIAVGAGVFTPDTSTPQYAVYFNTASPGGMQKMGTGTLGGGDAQANAVNGVGTAFEAVGQSLALDPSSATPVERAFLWKSSAPSTPTQLDPSGHTGLGDSGAGSFSNAQGLNSTGYIVGQATVAHAVSDPVTAHGFLYSPVTLQMYDLGTAAGTGFHSSDAVAINDSDVIVGSTDVAGNYSQAFKYSGFGLPSVANPSLSGGTMTPLGSLDNTNSEASAINDAGIIVGDSSANDSVNHAFVYDSTGLHDLNSLADLPAGWLLSTATGINDSGDITGLAYYTDPAAPDAGSTPFPYELSLNLSAVPEPAGLGIVAITAYFALSRRRRTH